MKIIIAHGGVKREINGSFELCISQTDLQKLFNQLKPYTYNNEFSYGWLFIDERINQVKPNTYPISWFDEAKI